MQSLVDISALCLTQHLERIDFARLPKDLHLPLCSKIQDHEYVIKYPNMRPYWMPETLYWSDRYWAKKYYCYYSTFNIKKKWNKQKLLTYFTIFCVRVINDEAVEVETLQQINHLLRRYRKKYPDYVPVAKAIGKQLLVFYRDCKPEWVPEEQYWSNVLGNLYYKDYHTEKIDHTISKLLNLVKRVQVEEQIQCTTVIFAILIRNQWYVEVIEGFRETVRKKLIELEKNKYYAEMVPTIRKLLNLDSEQV